MSLAVNADVAKRLGRALNPGEITQVDEYLKDAEAAILNKLPNALTKAGTDAVYHQNLISVEVSVTLRAARLTDAVQAAYPGTETLAIQPGYSRANVTVLDSEWRKLGLTWYSSFSPSQNNADAGIGTPGFYPDMNPSWGPWWLYGED